MALTNITYHYFHSFTPKMSTFAFSHIFNHCALTGSDVHIMLVRLCFSLSTAHNFPYRWTDPWHSFNADAEVGLASTMGGWTDGCTMVSCGRSPPTAMRRRRPLVTRRRKCQKQQTIRAEQPDDPISGGGVQWVTWIGINLHCTTTACYTSKQPGCFHCTLL